MKKEPKKGPDKWEIGIMGAMLIIGASILGGCNEDTATGTSAYTEAAKSLTSGLGLTNGVYSATNSTNSTNATSTNSTTQ